MVDHCQHRNQVVTFHFDANPGTSRTGHITLFGQSITITQSAANYVLATTNLLEGPVAGSDGVFLTITPGGVPWTASANAPWLSLMTPNGVGSSNVMFAFEQNLGRPAPEPSPWPGKPSRSRKLALTMFLPCRYTLSTIAPQPEGIVVDPAGNVFFGDAQKVYRMTATNTSIIATGMASARLALDTAGNLYIADLSHHVIKKWDFATSNLTTLVSAGLSSPWGIALDASNNIYIGDAGSDTLKKWWAASNSVTTLVSSGLPGTRGVALDPQGNVYIACKTDNTVKKWTATSGAVSTLVSSLNQPQGVTVDGSGNLYIADSGNNIIEKWNASSGTLTTIAPGMFIPQSTAIDARGSLYISDSGNGHVVKLPRAFLDPTPRSVGPLAARLRYRRSSTNYPLTGTLTPTSDQAWLTITGITNGAVNFSCLPLGTNRVGHISLLGYSIAITQSGFITTFGTTNLLEGPGGGMDSVVFGVFPASTAWAATTTNSWLHIANAVGTNGATLVFTFDPNPGATRTGAISNLNQIVTITQAGVSTCLPGCGRR